MCARCEELEERVAWLESELGLRNDADELATLQRAFGIMPCVAKAVSGLYAARGRIVTKMQLEELVQPQSEELSSNYMRMLVCKARRALGDDAFENVFGVGYKMTPAGLAKVAAALTPLRSAA